MNNLPLNYGVPFLQFDRAKLKRLHRDISEQIHSTKRILQRLDLLIRLSTPLTYIALRNQEYQQQVRLELLKEQKQVYQRYLDTLSSA